MKVDLVIIGAGLAGLVLRKALSPTLRVALVDPHPAAWKIGEANVPEMFASPFLAAVVERAKQLPSYARKNGSVFIGDDSIAAYPIVSNAFAALHVARDELEELFLHTWKIEVSRDAVEEVDLERRIVRTREATYESAGPIIDCSGGAMFLAQRLGEVKPLWPIHAAWAYWDVDRVAPSAFFEHADRAGKPVRFIDIPKLRTFSDEMRSTWAPHEATCLTKIEDGTWMWQIPLFRARMLSVGLVSRHGPVSEEALERAVETHRNRAYEVRPRPRGDASVYDRFHERSGFARRASRAASPDHILIGDAFMFVDPIYSVGTSLAVNKALEVAAILNRGAWTPKMCDLFVSRYEALLRKRSAAFHSWYAEEARATDPETARVQRELPGLTVFQAGITHQYAKVVEATLKLTRDVNAALEAR